MEWEHRPLQATGSMRLSITMEAVEEGTEERPGVVIVDVEAHDEVEHSEAETEVSEVEEVAIDHADAAIRISQ
jgi:hypothetical protein